MAALGGSLVALGLRTTTAKKKKKKRKPCPTCPTCATCPPVPDPCPAGQLRLSNGTCALACTSSSECPTVCNCLGANEEVQDLCSVPFTNADCPQVPQVCESTADCPRGQHCIETLCGQGGLAENRCLQLCAV